MNIQQQWDAISRHEIMSVVDELRTQYLLPPPPDLPPRRLALLKAAAHATMLVDRKAWQDPDAVARFWQGDGKPPSRTALRGLAGLIPAVVPTIRDLDSLLAPWTGGFWFGLRLSGALNEWRRRLRLMPGRPWLEADIERMEWPGRLGLPNQRGRWLCACETARLPPKSELGADVLAGLLAGARRHEEPDGVWLTLPRNERTLRLLYYFGVSVSEGPLPCRRGQVRLGVWISPFYGRLVSHLMPPETTESLGRIRRAGACPVLPLAYWQVLYGAGQAAEHYFNPPRAGLLPYLVSHTTRRRLGYSPEFLYRASVRLGVAHVPLEMRQLITHWRTRNDVDRQTP